MPAGGAVPAEPAHPGGLHRQVWTMAAPIVVANVTVPLLGAVDTAVVGHLAEVHYIGAVAIGSMLYAYLHHLFNCLRMGTTGPTAQARGAGDHAEVRAMIGRALLLGAVLGGAIVALQVPIADLAFRLIDASEQVETLARTYFGIRIWALPASLGLYAVIGWLYGLRDARGPLALQVFTNGVNIVLDLAFVFGLGWGVAGVAAASLIAEYAGLAIGLTLVALRLRSLPDDGRRVRIVDRARLARMAAVNGDIVVRTFCVVSVLAVFMAKSAALGDLALAANQVLHLFLVFSSFGLDGFAHAGEAILGERAGRHDRAGFRHAARVVFLWAGLVGALNALVYAIAGDAIVAALTSLPEVRAEAAVWMAWPALMPLVAVWAYTYDGVYLAATRTRYMRDTMIVSAVIFLGAVHLLMPLYGNAGLWSALALFLAGRGVLLHLGSRRLLAAI